MWPGSQRETALNVLRAVVLVCGVNADSYFRRKQSMSPMPMPGSNMMDGATTPEV
ncbi:hypothetical protein P3T73_00555 [Kiritimatiellota bacterium B12222]|nr:hypothetical protein P3T73_00550 [Kiritimatiellota bacterium B12222]WFB36252.1 hypothetical protein P3T73_00555 [Kiritimatiellota bacterium B12222]